MSNLVNIDIGKPALAKNEQQGPSRRDLIKALAFAVAATGGVMEDIAAAQHVHAEATSSIKATGAYVSREMSGAEFKTLERLAELIVPADDVSGSAREAGAAPFIDVLCSQNKKLAEIYHGGLAWLDAEMNKRYGKSFVNASPADQTAMLDLLVQAEKLEKSRVDEVAGMKKAAYRDFADYSLKPAHPLAAGAKFFDWVRKMTVDAFYTSPLGVNDLGYMGSGVYSKYEVPKKSMDYAMKRSPLA